MTSCTTFKDPFEDDPFEAFSGGTTTTFDQTVNAFDIEAPGLTIQRSISFISGNASFNISWTPPGNAAITGLGPVFNARSCRGCHIRDGRGKPPDSSEENMVSMLMKLSAPGKDPLTKAPKAHEVYGGQLQDKAIGGVGVKPEGRATISYEEIEGQYFDGQKYSLRKPTYNFTWNFGDPGEFEHSPRVATQVYGLGLLGTIPLSTLQQFVKNQAQNTSNISGKLNIVYNDLTKGFSPGKYGWKAGKPSLMLQNAGAAFGDIGLTSPIHTTTNCTPAQIACAAQPDGENGHPQEISQTRLDKLEVYTHLISVPGRRGHKRAIVIEGKRLFNNAGCSHCHIPQIQTGINEDFPELNNQRIYPYTDLLLHDMGEGLADHRDEFEANGREWRTAPLWGVGLIEKVNGHTNFLHDGRARGFAEAILWHGGEALEARNNFRAMALEEREALIEFLESL